MDDEEDDEEARFVAPPLEVNLTGLRCTGYGFSMSAPRSCSIYDKTKELSVSRMEWMKNESRASGAKSLEGAAEAYGSRTHPGL